MILATNGHHYLFVCCEYVVEPHLRGSFYTSAQGVDHDMYLQVITWQPPTDRGSETQSVLDCLIAFGILQLSIHVAIIHHHPSMKFRHIPSQLDPHCTRVPLRMIQELQESPHLPLIFHLRAIDANHVLSSMWSASCYTWTSATTSSPPPIALAFLSTAFIPRPIKSPKLDFVCKEPVGI